MGVLLGQGAAWLIPGASLEGRSPALSSREQLGALYRMQGVGAGVACTPACARHVGGLLHQCRYVRGGWGPKVEREEGGSESRVWEEELTSVRDPYLWYKP